LSAEGVGIVGRTNTGTKEASKGGKRGKIEKTWANRSFWGMKTDSDI